MDAIDRAIQRGWHVSNNTDLNRSTWKEFTLDAEGKTLVLFGCGKGAEFYYYKFGESAQAEIIIDNNSALQGIEAQKIFSEKIDENHKDIKITDISVLNNYVAEEVIVLVTSLRYYAEIIEQLKGMGIENTYALLAMEANERKLEEQVERIDRNDFYIQEACSQEICKNKIVFLTMCDYAGHGKEIAKQLLNKGKQLEIVWLVDDLRIQIPQGIKLVSKRNLRQCYLEMESAKIWICDTGIPRNYIKRQGQIYIQVKHWASVTLKNFGFDLARARQDEAMLAYCRFDSEMIDYIITGSRFDTETCRSGFAFDGTIIEVGSPRTDLLFHAEEVSENVREKYNISKDAGVVLYAPTFRCEKAETYKPNIVKADLDFDNIKNALESKFGGEWYVFLRLHPIVAKQSKNIEKNSFVIDVSDYYDSEELIAASDIMITDYSSIMFEPAFVGKPVFLFATDRKEYIDEERQLLIDYDSLPFSISESNEELALKIEQFDKKLYQENVARFLEKYGVCEEGHASERAADFIMGLLI